MRPLTSKFRMNVLLVIMLFLAFTCFNDKNTASAADHTILSQYTSIRDNDCFELPKALTNYYDQRQLDADECPAPKGWRIFRVFSMDSFWIDIANDDSLWSTEKVVMHGLDYANPSESSDVLEWRITRELQANGLIFRVTTLDPDTLKSRSELYVFSLVGKAPRFCGVAKSNRDALSITDKATTCNSILPKIAIPK